MPLKQAIKSLCLCKTCYLKYKGDKLSMSIYNNFQKIVIKECPLIDVRAPIEFEKGAFINTINLPIMSDKERHLVGICYKEKGNEEATILGHQLVSGEIKRGRINAWTNYLEKHPDSVIYCFRGGQRSQIAQKWIQESAGKEIMRLEGGYKAFRNYLLSELEPSQQKSKPILLGGCTGSGKTLLLKKLENAIDLEGIANHRGSSFGKKITPQPSPINFENNLAYALIQHKYKGYQYMVLEDEGKHVGARFLPNPLAAYFNTGDLVILKVPFEKRVKITMDEYVYESQEKHITAYGEEEGLIEWASYIETSLVNIQKRLGKQECRKVIDVFKQAYHHQLNTGTLTQHNNWIEMLLRDYYDPMYQYQIEKTTHNIIFEGNTAEVLNFLKDQYAL